MSKKHAITTAALAALATAGGLAAASTAAAQTAAPPPPPSVTTRWNGSPETREEDRRFHVNGRFMYDVAATDADCANAGCTGTNESGIRSYARRAFLGVDGRFTEHWRYNVKFDFTFGNNGSTSVAVPGQTIVTDLNLDGDTLDPGESTVTTLPTTVSVPNNGTSVKADDLYLEYAGDNFSLFIGNHNAVVPMEDRDSSLNTPFNERSFLITSSGFGKRPGIALLTNGGNWSLGGALQSNDALDSSDTASNGTESYFGIARGTWAPIYQQTPDGVTLLHLGVSARYRNNGDGNGNSLLAALGQYSPGGLSNRQSNNAGVGGAESDTYLGGEIAFQYKAFGMEAEYGHIDANDTIVGSQAASQTGDASADGYYVDFFWSPTGESRRYNAADGSFGAVAPLRTLGSDGGIGHVMLAARYESMDLSDVAFGSNRSELTAYTLGATWIPIQHVKFQLNYSNTDIDYSSNNVVPDAAHVDNTISAVTLRTQFDW